MATATGRLKWEGEKVRRELEAGMMRRLKFVAAWLTKRVKMNISQPVRKVRRTRQRKTSRGEKGSSYTWVIPDSRSKPGEFPKAETGTLMRDIFWRPITGNFEVIVATSKRYGALLETRMNRSFLRKTLDMHKKDVEKLFVKQKPGDGDLFKVKGS